jgi:outer membrane protein assembly factor BamB
VRRRQVLAAGALALSVGVAGCNERTPPPDESFDHPDDRWLSPGYDPGNTGHAPVAPEPAEERWRTDRRATDPPLFGTLSTPVVGEHVYVAGLADRFFRPEDDSLALVALDRASGDPVWTLGFDGGLSGEPALVDSRLVVGGYDSRLHGVSTDGERRWSLSLDSQSGTPTPYGDRVYVADGDGSLHAVTADGERIWRVRREFLLERLAEPLLGDDDPIAVGAPAVDERGVYLTVASFDEDREAVVLLAYDHRGNRRWRRVFERAAAHHVRGPTVADGTVYAVVGKTVVALEADDGSEQWRFVTGYSNPGPAAIDGERCYVGAKNLYALDAATGTERWRVVNEAVQTGMDWTRGVPYVARPAVADGAVHLRAGAFDASTGERRWGDDADAWVTETDYFDEDFRYRPSVRPAVTSEALYLTHAIDGVVRLG